MTGRFNQNGVKFQVHVLAGPVADSLVDYVDANQIDQVIIATLGCSGISRRVRGSRADRILRSARPPILMVRADYRMSG